MGVVLEVPVRLAQTNYPEKAKCCRGLWAMARINGRECEF